MPENAICVVGNVSREPELRFTPNGKAVVNFSVAVSGRKKNGNEWVDDLHGFFDCSAWDQLAENVAESLTRGTRVVVTGRLKQRSWEDGTGNKRTAVEIQVDDIGASMRFATVAITKPDRGQGHPATAAEAPASQTSPTVGAGGF